MPESENNHFSGKVTVKTPEGAIVLDIRDATILKGGSLVNKYLKRKGGDKKISRRKPSETEIEANQRILERELSMYEVARMLHPEHTTPATLRLLRHLRNMGYIEPTDFLRIQPDTIIPGFGFERRRKIGMIVEVISENLSKTES
jgi:hypothetical protein